MLGKLFEQHNLHCYLVMHRVRDWPTRSYSYPSAPFLQVTSPGALLRPADVSALAPQLSGLLVTCATPLPHALTAALLHAGCRAVVCPDTPLLPPPTTPQRPGAAHASTGAGSARADGGLAVGGLAGGVGGERTSVRQVAALFERMVAELAAGQSLAAALDAAEHEAPGLRGSVAVHLA